MALFAVSLIALSAVAEDKQAEATFATKSHDFGTIQEEKGPVSCTFEFTNTGDKPLLIIDAIASCGCTRPEFPTKPIKPFKKTVKVKTNGKERTTTLRIHGTVTPKQ